MPYEQTVTPNVDSNTLYVTADGQPGNASNCLKDWLGKCLAVTSAAFGGTTAKQPNAQKAWDDEITKHTDADMPEGVFVPIYWLIDGGPYKGQGHIAPARRTGDQLEVWTSPYTHKAAFDYFHGSINNILNQVASIYFSGQGHFLGWTECLTGKRVVEQVAEPTPTPTPQPAPTPEEPGYIVKPGDTLGQIAIDQGWSDGSNLWGPDGYVAKLAAKNGIADPNLIYPGQVIKRA